MNEKRIYINEDEIFFVEKYWFELQGLKDLVVQFISNSELTVNNDKFEKILKEYLEAYIAFNIAYNKIISKYVEDYEKKNVFIDFEKLCIIIENDSCKTCKY